MAGQDPSPQTTLLILLGASSWPLSGLESSTAFENAVRGLRAYFLSDSHGFHLPESHVLDLFNSNESGPDILNRISDFLRDHVTMKKEASVDVRDILTYYVGHGGITRDSSIFYLAIQRTRKDYEKATSIAIDDLAERLKKGARFQRRILVLDCCFAAAAVKFLQGPASTVLKEKTITAFEEKDQGKGFPSKGTSFLASSGKDIASVILPDETSTMFTSAFLSILRTGDPFQKRERLPLSTVHRLTIDFLSKTYGDNFPWPELHSPDQTEGKVEDVPFFPNPWVEKERVRKAKEEEQARLAEEEQERVRKAKEEEQARLAEVEQVRLAEEERARKAEEEEQVRLAVLIAVEQVRPPEEEEQIRLAEVEQVRLAEEERARKAEEEEQVRLAEEERARKAKEKRARKAKEKRAKKDEEERAKKDEEEARLFTSSKPQVFSPLLLRNFVDSVDNSPQQTKLNQPQSNTNLVRSKVNINNRFSYSIVGSVILLVLLNYTFTFIDPSFDSTNASSYPKFLYNQNIIIFKLNQHIFNMRYILIGLYVGMIYSNFFYKKSSKIVTLCCVFASLLEIVIYYFLLVAHINDFLINIISFTTGFLLIVIILVIWIIIDEKLKKLSK